MNIQSTLSALAYTKAGHMNLLNGSIGESFLKEYVKQEAKELGASAKQVKKALFVAASNYNVRVGE